MRTYAIISVVVAIASLTFFIGMDVVRLIRWRKDRAKQVKARTESK